MQSLSSAEQAILRRVMGAMGGGQGGRPGGRSGNRGRRQQQDNFQFGGSYIVFVMRETGPEALPIRTGLTDLEYAEVAFGLTEDDLVLILPSASLVQSQQQMQERINRMTGGGGLPGVRTTGRGR